MKLIFYFLGIKYIANSYYRYWQNSQTPATTTNSLNYYLFTFYTYIILCVYAYILYIQYTRILIPYYRKLTDS